MKLLHAVNLLKQAEEDAVTVERTRVLRAHYGQAVRKLVEFLASGEENQSPSPFSALPDASQSSPEDAE